MPPIANVTFSTPIDSKRTVRRCSILLLALVFFSPTLMTGPFAAGAQVETSEVKVAMGFRDRAKLGCWQPFVVTTPDRIEPSRFEITVLDGDESPITYADNLHPIGSGFNQHQGYFKLGRRYGTAALKLLDRNGLVVAETTIPLGRSNNIELLDATTTLILAFEPTSVLARTIEATTFMGGRGKTAAVISLASPESIPLDWFGYEGVDSVFLVTSDIERINKISDLQWRALDRWIENGGRLIFSATANSEILLGANGMLSRFSPGRFGGLSEITSSNRLEAFASNRQLIPRGGEPVAIAQFDELTGRVALAQDDKPLIIRSAKGFGEIICVTFDLDSPRIVEWAGYSNLIHRLQSETEPSEAVQTSVANSRGTSVSHYGYDDLIGQLRVPLDRFSGVQFLAFNWIALLIGLYILCIGPGDYFFLKRLAGKMELTWITFPLVSLLFCGLAIWIASVTRPHEIQLNQLEIIDIDASSKHVRGTVWSNVYSPVAGNVQISLDRKNALGFETDSDLLSWHGLPGTGLGGMQTKVSPGLMKAGYQHTIETGSSSDGGPGRSVLNGVPLYVSATKPLFAQYNATFPTPIRSNLKLSRTSARLEGTLINPLDVPLKNARLMFENYAYVLKKRQLEPDETIDVMTEMKERTVRSLLTRRTKSADDESKTQNSPWEPTETRINRIADVLMFYEAAGGNNYTGLTHAYQNFVDMSEHLELGRAILVGEIESMGTPLILNGKNSSEQYDQTETIVRIVLPVTYDQK